jgi:sugar lactone lactonase YvrE
MNKSLQGTLIIFFIAVIASVTGCKKSADATYPVPLVITNNVLTNLTSTSVSSGGILLNVDNISANGVCYSTTNHTPTIADSKTADSIQTRFSSKPTGLTPNTTYYLRAYVTGSTGTGYGDVISFTTNATAAVPLGTVTTIAGSPGNSGFAIGTGTAALFDGPQNIAYNATNGFLYVSDVFNNLIRTVTTTGTVSAYSAGTLGFVNGPLATAQFYGPKGISFDAQGNAYVADLGNSVIRKITTAGVVSTFAGNGFAGYVNGAATAAEFYNPQATATDAQGNVYVADRSNNLIRKITPAGVTSVLAGVIAATGYPQSAVAGYADGDPTLAQFNYPNALTVDAQGNVFVADFKNQAIREVTPAGTVSTYAGNLNFPNVLGTPSGIVVDTKGNLFIADSSGRILELTPAKVLYVLAGSANTVGFADGVGAAAKFSNPSSLTLDAQGNLYVADFGNNVIRKIVVAVQ